MKFLYLSIVILISVGLWAQKIDQQAPLSEIYGPEQSGRLDYQPPAGRSFQLKFRHSTFPGSCSYSAARNLFTLHFLARAGMTTLIYLGRPEHIQIIRRPSTPALRKEISGELEEQGFQKLPPGTSKFVPEYLQVLKRKRLEAKHSQLCFVARDTATREQWVITLTGDLQFKSYLHET